MKFYVARNSRYDTAVYDYDQYYWQVDNNNNLDVLDGDDVVVATFNATEWTHVHKELEDE